LLRIDRGRPSTRAEWRWWRRCWAPRSGSTRRAHHERWDGSGYPRGLRGESIPIAGRLVAIADAYDAMTHYRGYRARTLTPAEAAAEIAAGGGGQFDPEFAEAFVTLQDEGRFT
jgi:HD-GYP domain-containing protein (c-di-GMP phosphodiesterase class II)